jgi:hypothetical protein
MSTGPNRTKTTLPPLEDALVILLRLVAKGDKNSAFQLARNMVARPPDGVSDPGAFREAIGQVLLGVGARGELMRSSSVQAFPVDAESKMPLVRLADLGATLREPVLNGREAHLLETLLVERGRADELVEVGLVPTRTVLLAGPPGVGKTMTAHYIAAKLGLSLITVDLAAIMSSFLGRTGQNLRAALDHARHQSAVVLVDEFDALAKRRDDEADVGELKRIVNVLLLELEDWPADSLLLAATNHPALLDPAIGRRFDMRIDMDLPDEASRREIVRQVLTQLRSRADPEVVALVALAFPRITGSDLVLVVERAAKSAFLDGRDIEPCLLEIVGAQVRHAGERARGAFALQARSKLGLSNRAIADHLGVTHPTVARLIRLSTSPDERPLVR